jgi:hypothetical protein
MTTFTIHTEDKEQLKALKAILKALKVKFEISKDDSSYHPDFVSKIEKSRKDFKEGKGTVISMNELNDLWK